MAYLQPDKPEKVYLPFIRAAKERGEKLVCLTAYDYPTARIVDEAGVDIILVGDSMGHRSCSGRKLRWFGRRRRVRSRSSFSRI